MSKPIRLQQAVSDQSSQRLNAFPGRNLSEHAFDLMQGYVDRRIDPLLGNGHPGIIEGLQLTTNHAGKQVQLHVQPGTAVAANGSAVRVFYPIELDWPALLSAHRQNNTQSEARLHGLYYLTVLRRVGRVEDSAKARPCTRDQIDPLRDSRAETYATLGLQFITSLSGLMTMSQQRAVNRLCVRHLDNPPFDSDSGAVPLAIVRIDNGTPQWIDTTGGRFLAQEHAAYHTFAAHWEEVLQSLTRIGSAPIAGEEFSSPGGLRPSLPGSLRINPDLSIHTRPDLLDRPLFTRPTVGELAVTNLAAELPQTLRTILGVDYMPAAGRFPEALVAEVAGHEAGESVDEWVLPQLLFDPRDLQVELLPIPASTAFGVIDRELPRGALDLVHYQGDRLRLMVAVEDRDYRSDLMDLAEVDGKLVDDLYERAQAAIDSEHAWALAHRELYEDLDRDLLGEDGALTDKALALIKHIYLVPGYSTVASLDYPKLGAEHRKQLGIPDPVGAVRTPDNFFSELRKTASGRPYSNTLVSAPEGYEQSEFAGYDEDGLYRQSADLADDILWLEESLEENHDLIDELNDFLAVQRQHLDAITTNFAALAGGVAGDGSGLRLMRWNSALRFEPKTNKQTETEG